MDGYGEPAHEWVEGIVTGDISVKSPARWAARRRFGREKNI